MFDVDEAIVSASQSKNADQLAACLWNLDVKWMTKMLHNWPKSSVTHKHCQMFVQFAKQFQKKHKRPQKGWVEPPRNAE